MALREHLRELRNRLLKACIGLLARRRRRLVPLRPGAGGAERAAIRRRAPRTVEASVNFAAVAQRVRHEDQDLGLHRRDRLQPGLDLPAVGVRHARAHHASERRYALAFIGAAVPLFCAGAYLAYSAIPNFVRFLVSFSPDGLLQHHRRPGVPRLRHAADPHLRAVVPRPGGAGRPQLPRAGLRPRHPQGVALGGRRRVHLRGARHAHARRAVDVPAGAAAAAAVRASPSASACSTTAGAGAAGPTAFYEDLDDDEASPL